MNWLEAISAMLDGKAVRLPGWKTCLRLTDEGICLCRGSQRRPLSRETLGVMGASGRMSWEIVQ